MKILFCRHGETLWNQQGRLQGHLDSELSLVGIQQARALGERLAPFNPSLIVCSDLGRAISTAELVNESLNIPVESSALLRERCFGELQGLYKGESEHLWQAYQQRFNADGIGIKDSESAIEVLNRVDGFLNKISKLAIDTLVVICHGEWLRVFQNSVLGFAPWSAQVALVGNCQIVEYEMIQSASELVLKAG
ncbi:histidine phosphatase family protein [Shewanella sp. 10N.286.45.A1]|uniref:histidine phosphatase family protein n=1 Tax=Shewanella sp. 10N.286.45.A1 TaxID=3229694 RepID=UPI00354F2191